MERRLCQKMTWASFYYGDGNAGGIAGSGKGVWDDGEENVVGCGRCGGNVGGYRKELL